MDKKLFIIFELFFLSSISVIWGQNNDRNWTFGINSSAVLFGEKGIDKVKDGLNVQFPSIQISRKLTECFSVDFMYTFEAVEFMKMENAFPYSSFDAYLRYNLPKMFLDIVPFGGVGLGYIKGASSTPDPKATISLNFMAGGTLWITKRVGLSGKLIYKTVSSNSTSMASHIQGLAGIVYKFDVNLKFGENRKRIWNRKH